ncbi:DUF2500 domain-containing protein [Vibrio gallicus]|uniref:DUF2500 domain-containing protein n=1 Tax=Vibrio gallicus TaxID=190897 RepID=UPI0021C262E4|nr:DUF2500 domain-containing protein [Vibrio gallicus]
MPLYFVAIIIALVVIAALLFRASFTRHVQGEGAQPKTANVTIIDKQAVDIPDATIEQEDREYWIYVQKGMLGPKREFKVGIHYFEALQPGNKGELTYQGDKFMHFSLKRNHQA